MRRRELLGLGTIGLGAAALDGCVPLPWARPTIPPEEIARILANMERTLAALRASKPDPRRLGVRGEVPNVEAAHATVTRTFGAMHVVGSYRDLPVEAKHDAAVQKRMGELLPEVHAAVTDARRSLVERPHADYARIDEALRKDPSLPMRMVEKVDELAQEYGVPFEQRTYLRTTITDLSWRLRNQGSKTVVDEIVGKYDRAVARAPLVGMPAEDRPQSSSADAPPPLLAPIVAKVRTYADEQDVAKAVCATKASLWLEGQRPVDLEWSGPGQVACENSGSADALRGLVRVDDDGAPTGWRTIVVVLRVPSGTPPSAVDKLFPQVDAIGQRVARTAEASMTRRTGVAPRTEPEGPKIGEIGHACWGDADCTGRYCDKGVCVDPKKQPSSKKLIKETGKVAIIGAWLLIPPICFIGILVLFTCSIMALVAGLMAAGGD